MARLTVRVRHAGCDDVPALGRLIASIDTSSGPFSGKPLVSPDAEHLRERLGHIIDEQRRVLLVAVDEVGDVVGMLSGRDDEVGAIDLTPVLHVTHLMVAPGARRRGVGRALLAAAVQVAEDTGRDHVLATAAAGSREGNRYLARIGFAPLVVHRLASTSTLRRSLGMTESVGRVAVLRRARLVRAQRAGLVARAAHRSA